MPFSPAALQLAEAWATLDGVLPAFIAERDGFVTISDPAYTAHFDGYCFEAEAFLEDGVTCSRGLQIERDLFAAQRD